MDIMKAIAETSALATDQLTVQMFELEHMCSGPNYGPRCLKKANSGGSFFEACSGTDVQIVCCTSV